MIQFIIGIAVGISLTVITLCLGLWAATKSIDKDIDSRLN